MLWLETRMGVRMFKVYCSSEVKQRCEVYLTWKVRGLWLVYFTTDISWQEKWVVKQTRKWGSWVGVTAVTLADTNSPGAGEGHSVMKRTIVPADNAQTTSGPVRDLLGSEKHHCPNACTSLLCRHNTCLETVSQADLTVGNQHECKTASTLAWTEQKPWPCTSRQWLTPKKLKYSRGSLELRLGWCFSLSKPPVRHWEEKSYSKD